MNNSAIITVKSHKIDKIHLYYRCPFCATIRGGRQVPISIKRKYKSAKNTEHFHGSGGDFSNRTEGRVSHCLFSSGNVDIIIDDSTVRV